MTPLVNYAQLAGECGGKRLSCSTVNGQPIVENAFFFLLRETWLPKVAFLYGFWPGQNTTFRSDRGLKVDNTAVAKKGGVVWWKAQLLPLC